MNCLVNYSDSSGDEEPTSAGLQLQSNSTVCRHRDNFRTEHEAQTTMLTSKQIPVNKVSCEMESVISAVEINNEHSTLESDGLLNLEPVHKSRKINNAQIMKPSPNSSANGKTVRDESRKVQLNLPTAIQSMFSGNGGHRNWKDDPTQHGNRKRSFPHVEGNWATHVFVPVRKDDRLVHFVHALVDLFKPLTFHLLPEFHVSLSRTVTIRHHWIEPLVDSLRQRLSSMHSCVGDLEEIRLYSNDERTRTFLCVEVSQEDTAFPQYVSAVDQCFGGFKLPPYYQNPSFHISVAWCLGDVCQAVSTDTMSQAKKLLVEFCASNPELSVVFAQTICCRAGNKSFHIPLIV